MKFFVTLSVITLALASRVAADAPKSIVGTAAGSKDFSTLVAAVKAAGLVDTLSSKGPFTVFAPTNAAFAKLPKGTVESLLKPENKAKLVGILTYHVVPGKVTAADVVKLKKAKTVQGSTVRIRVKGDQVRINKAKVVKTDILCSNGVIHVIDSVILPPKKTDRAAAAKQIEQAIAKGSGLFNAGHHGACAKMYRATLARLMNEKVDGVNWEHMGRTLATIDKTYCATSRSWALRAQMARLHRMLMTSRP